MVAGHAHSHCLKISGQLINVSLFVGISLQLYSKTFHFRQFPLLNQNSKTNIFS